MTYTNICLWDDQTKTSPIPLHLGYNLRPNSLVHVPSPIQVNGSQLYRDTFTRLLHRTFSVGFCGMMACMVSIVVDRRLSGTSDADTVMRPGWEHVKFYIFDQDERMVQYSRNAYTNILYSRSRVRDLIDTCYGKYVVTLLQVLLYVQ